MPTSRKLASGEASQPAPRRREPLTRDRVLAAALSLVDAEGVDALTMRRLARELGCNAMALYRYAASRDALLDGVVETVMTDLVILADGTDWEAQLRRTAHEFRSIALAHPHVVPLLVTRPLSTPLGLRPLGTVRPLEMLLTLLVGAGFSAEDALHVYRVYFGFLYGHVLTELQELVASPEESDDLLRLGLHRLPPGEFPLVRQLASALAGYDGVTELDEGLDILLTGLRDQLHIPVRRR
ncbi:TetR/AcrR family transcriptional regulator [Georgenia yuyongxinii]|uniref:TetR family transcriptional regulator n=1 Tax=Georgenia yuyongxinii TaxID=2589797 RepID=A0A552WKU2_9MICO|nr:TetR/AcrR family transcriptional regulator C-terminal domain-containing protein [Georgenia yuyongxinii]TRW43093.1 TetR family transcriptional regulator [Georgenia yuyongxinii]